MSPGNNSYDNIHISGNARAHLGHNYYHNGDSEDAKILRWLHGEINPWSSQQDIHLLYQPGTLDWFFDGTVMKSWLAADAHSGSQPRTLWCHGEMGMGKTILASRIVERLRSCPTPRTRTAVVYCYHSEKCSQTVELVLGTILAQWYKDSGGSRADIPDKVRHAFRQTCPLGKQNPTLAELQDWLCEATSDHARQPTVLVLDGLDELVDSVRAKILHCLSPVSLPGIKLFVTSRFTLDEADIGTDRFEHTSIELSTRKSDIECLVSQSLKSQVANRLMSLSKTRSGRRTYDKSIIGEITSQILAKADTFLLGSCHLARILDCATICEIYHCLEILPETLGEAYDQAWKRAVGSKHQYQRNQARIALTWVLLAKQPLSVLALNEAVAVSMESDSPDLAEFLPDIERLCAGLVKIETQPCPNRAISDLCDNLRAHSRVLVAHRSIHEYFERRKQAYFPAGEQLVTNACIRVIRNSATMAIRTSPFTAILAHCHERLDRLWRPNEAPICATHSNRPTAETLMQYTMVWSSTHITSTPKRYQLRVWIVVLLWTISRIQIIHFLALSFALAISGLSGGVGNLSENRRARLSMLHYYSGTKTAVHLMQIVEQRNPSRSVVQKRPCHSLWDWKRVARSVCCYVVLSCLYGRLAALQLGWWDTVFLDAGFYVFAGCSIPIDRPADDLVESACGCARCQVLETSQRAVAGVLAVIGIERLPVHVRVSEEFLKGHLDDLLLQGLFDQVSVLLTNCLI